MIFFKNHNVLMLPIKRELFDGVKGEEILLSRHYLNSSKKVHSKA